MKIEEANSELGDLCEGDETGASEQLVKKLKLREWRFFFSRSLMLHQSHDTHVYDDSKCIDIHYVLTNMFASRS